MKGLLFITCFIFTIVANAKDDVILYFDNITNQTCSNSKHKDICKKRVLAIANFAMVYSGFYTEHCLGSVSDKDRKICDDSEKIVNHIKLLNEDN